jgi:hypothetical protein
MLWRGSREKKLGMEAHELSILADRLRPPTRARGVTAQSGMNDGLVVHS